MKRFIVAAAATALLTGLAYAQEPKRDDDPMVIYEKTKKEEAEQVDKQYQRTLKRTNQGLPAQPAADPWANMRGPADNTATKR